MMSPEVTRRKLTYLHRYIDALRPYAHSSRDTVEKNRYAIERLCHLIVEVLSDITTHLLVERHGYTAGSYREAFYYATEQNIFSEELGEKLMKAAGLRNLLVHMYEDIDFDQLFTACTTLIDVAERAGRCLLECIEQS